MLTKKQATKLESSQEIK